MDVPSRIANRLEDILVTTSRTRTRQELLDPLMALPVWCHCWIVILFHFMRYNVSEGTELPPLGFWTSMVLYFDLTICVAYSGIHCIKLPIISLGVLEAITTGLLVSLFRSIGGFKSLTTNRSILGPLSGSICRIGSRYQAYAPTCNPIQVRCGTVPPWSRFPRTTMLRLKRSKLQVHSTHKAARLIAQASHWEPCLRMLHPRLLQLRKVPQPSIRLRHRMQAHHCQ